MRIAPNYIDIAGQKFGRLTALSRDRNHPRKERAMWLCRCDCGNFATVESYNLRRNWTHSCGCFHKEQTSKARKTHGIPKTARVYGSWCSIKQRCLNSSCARYKDYGGRGITICERWMKFENFLADMGHPPAKHTIERIDNDGNYEPRNCRWATYVEQGGNTRTNRMICINGVTKCATHWAREFGIKPSVALSRIFQGWNDIEAVSMPVRSSH